MTDKHCNGCGRDKPISEFNKNQSRCKVCKTEAHRKWASTHLAELAEYKAEWARTHVEQTRAAKQAYYQNHKTQVAAAGRRLRYGLTQEQFEALLLHQGSKCAICLTDKPRGHGNWHVDHDHQTGKVRGLLCTGCNLGVGHLKDDPSLLRKAAQYLEAAIRSPLGLC